MEKINFSKIYSDEKRNSMQKLNLDGYDYSRFTVIDDFELDQELLKKFSPIAKKLNLSQEAVETLLDLALEMSKKQDICHKEKTKNKLKNDIEAYRLKLINDSEIPDVNSEKIRDYMLTADFAYDNFASDELKDILNNTGLIYHPELIKMFHTIGELMKEDGINSYKKPYKEELSPAEILYGNRINENKW